MGRLTHKEPNGHWWIPGVNFADLPKGVYGALCKLLHYEETGLSPNEVERMRNKAEEIHIGSMIQGYEVFGIYGGYCIAKNRNAPEPYVVWKIDNDKCGVHSGSYRLLKEDAEQAFIRKAFIPPKQEV